MMVPECKITRIECYRFDDELSDKLLPGHNRGCHCGMITLSTSLGTCGLGDYAIPCGNLKGDFVQWAAVFQKLKGLSLEDGLHYVYLKKEAWGAVRTHMMESALLDLSVKLGHVSAGIREPDFLSDRSYVFDHSEAYICF
ncbi:hypothetical protein [Paenibacillus planticolens]|uniref:Uncharacterized protein n=1 Tax=Paenibacillus planticolens TaxID=2654976 RepID=A0ABX1ZQ16_9BACL|nr:hypothetical protein [Paenibacillus planticolens]NOV01748.1 hypothetical protein [Paenibacillus planticolens]